MKISESWLREWVNPPVATEQLVQQVTMAGLEVDAVTPVAGHFSGVVVAQILSAEPHPDAQKLRVCQVDAGGEPLQIVCGAANARAGIKVPLAQVGALLPAGLEIKKAKLRGVESFGMLCGQTELAAGTDDSGLWELPAEAPVGADLRDYLQLSDQILELDLTPNRSDCLSLRGVAREVGVLTQAPVKAFEQAVQPVTSDHSKPVQVSAPAACPRYLARTISNIDISAPSPMWLRTKLERAGLRSIDAVVDVTNFVLLELGQPTHAFDLAKLTGAIEVRMARPGEQLALLNDQYIDLREDCLVIADEAQPLALAGIMGGKSSAVSAQTQSILLESAFFSPAIIAGRARSFGLHTDSSHRFERGVDYNLQRMAMERATELLLSIVGGSAGPIVEALSGNDLPVKAPIRLNKKRLAQGLGLEIPSEEVVRMLTALGLGLAEETAEYWLLSVPSFRFDISIDADLLEEVARIYGYARLPTRISAFAVEIANISDSQTEKATLKRHLVSRNFQEIITYSFIDPKLHQTLFPSEPAVQLQNPISADMASMRTSLLPGLVATLKTNLNRQHNRAKLFETGLVFAAKAGYPQQEKLGGLIYGARHSLHWAHDKTDVDFYDLKAEVELLFALGGTEVKFVAATDLAHMHPGQSAYVIVGGKPVGVLGALHPLAVKSLDLPKPAYVFEIELDALRKGALPQASGISRFPEVSRDLALVVDKHVSALSLQKVVEHAAGEGLKQVTLFDVYSGQGIDLARKSLAFSLLFQHSSRTLTDDEIQASMDRVIQQVAEEFNATLR
ncbi:MAG: phenylalanine--tRNA ligase subunit beta [Marinagarivorans sp.]